MRKAVDNFFAHALVLSKRIIAMKIKKAELQGIYVNVKDLPKGRPAGDRHCRPFQCGQIITDQQTGQPQKSGPFQLYPGKDPDHKLLPDQRQLVYSGPAGVWVCPGQQKEQAKWARFIEEYLSKRRQLRAYCSGGYQASPAKMTFCSELAVSAATAGMMCGYQGRQDILWGAQQTPGGSQARASICPQG